MLAPIERESLELLVELSLQQGEHVDKQDDVMEV